VRSYLNIKCTTISILNDLQGFPEKEASVFLSHNRCSMQLEFSPALIFVTA